MLIVSGWLRIARGRRDHFLAVSRDAMVAARTAPGCLGFVVAADPLESDLVNVYERWDSETELMAFRADGPSADMAGLIVGGSVRRYEIASEGPA